MFVVRLGFLRLTACQWLSGSVEHCWESFRLALLLLLQFSCASRKEMSKNDKVNGCAQNTTHSDSHTHTHTSIRSLIATPPTNIPSFLFRPFPSSFPRALVLLWACPMHLHRIRICVRKVRQFYMHLIYVSPAL